jgi:hypothetical protein
LWFIIAFFFEHGATVRAFIVAFLDKTVTNLTCKHFFFVFNTGFFIEVFDFSVLGSKQGKHRDQFETFQC